MSNNRKEKTIDEIRAKYGSVNMRGNRPHKPELTD